MADKHHSFTEKFLHWTYCSKCGLMILKNEPSKKAANKPCESVWDEKRVNLNKINKWYK